MKSLKILFVILLIGSTGSFSSTAFAEPQMTAIIEKTTYTYCERLSYTIEVSEITGELAIIHIRDEADKKSSAIPIPIGNATAIPAMLIAATINKFAMLNITPPKNAFKKEIELPWLRSSKKLLPFSPKLPNVNPNIKENKITPIE